MEQPTYGITVGDRQRIHRDQGDEYIIDYLRQSGEQIIPDEDHEYVARLGFLAAHDLDNKGDDYNIKRRDLEAIDTLSLKLDNDPKAPLDDQELDFLYALTRPIEEFDYKIRAARQKIHTMRDNREGMDNERIKLHIIEAVREQSAVSFETYKNAMISINETRRSWWRFLNSSDEPGLQIAKYGVELALHRKDLKSIKFMEDLKQEKEEELSKVLEQKIQLWEENGVFDWCADYSSKNGGNFILTVTPNVLLLHEEIRCLASNFNRELGNDEPLCRRNEVNERYSAEELSGKPEENELARFSLIASRDTRSFNTIAGHNATISGYIWKGLDVHIPSVLETVLYSRTIAKTSEHDPFIYVPHINLPSRYDNGYWPLIPLTCGISGKGPIAVANDSECLATYAIR